jgi:hypothetical protein
MVEAFVSSDGRMDRIQVHIMNAGLCGHQFVKEGVEEVLESQLLAIRALWLFTQFTQVDHFPTLGHRANSSLFLGFVAETFGEPVRVPYGIGDAVVEGAELAAVVKESGVLEGIA